VSGSDRVTDRFGVQTSSPQICGAVTSHLRTSGPPKLVTLAMPPTLSGLGATASPDKTPTFCSTSIAQASAACLQQHRFQHQAFDRIAMAMVVVCWARRRHLCFDLDVTFDAECRFEIRFGDRRASFFWLVRICCANPAAGAEGGLCIPHAYRPTFCFSMTRISQPVLTQCPTCSPRSRSKA
jgi:hypothetical protein